MPEIRELPFGARQSEADDELTLEQPAESLFCRLCRLGRTSRRRKGKGMMSAWFFHEIEWYRVDIRLYKNVVSFL